MDSFEFNKIAGAVLATALGVMALSIVSEMVFHPAEAEQPGFVVAVAEEGATAGGGGAPEVEPIAVRLAAANIDAGQQSTAKCKSCHTFDKGDPRQTPGPNLYGVVGMHAAHLESFPNYSPAMKEKQAEGLVWNFENLDHFLTNPKAFIPGTAMTFAGIRNPQERANLIAYLNQNSDSPLPLPDAAAAAEEAPAAEAPAATETAPAATEAPAAETATPPTAAEPAPAPSPEPPAIQVPPESPAVETAPSATTPDATAPDATAPAPEAAPGTTTP
jgi:cytochrome c